MKSLSSASQVRLLGIGTSSSSRNIVFRSSLNSNRVSFGLPPPRSSTNGVLSVAAKISSDSTSSYDALERFAIEAGKILVKEVANMFEEIGAADDVQRLVEEAANALAEKSSDDKDETENNDTSYVAELQRYAAKTGKVLLVKDLTTDEDDETAKKSVERKMKEKRVAERVMAEEVAARKINEKSSLGDSYGVGDFIKMRIGSDVIKGVVISKDYNVTRLETFTEKTLSPVKRIIAVDNHKMSWVEILD